jgi:hypothetical protein
MAGWRPVAGLVLLLVLVATAGCVDDGKQPDFYYGCGPARSHGPDAPVAPPAPSRAVGRRR